MGLEVIDVVDRSAALAATRERPNVLPAEALHVARVAPTLATDDLLTCSPHDLWPRASAVAEKLGYARLPAWDDAGWEEPSPLEARRIFLHVLPRGLAYGSRTRAVSVVRGEVDALLAELGGAVRVLSGTDLFRILDDEGERPRIGGYGSGAALTASTFEVAVFLVGAAHVALLLVTDED